MQLTRRQWFGLITFVILLVASILVTVEPWKKSSASLVSSSEGGVAPVEIFIRWNGLGDGYPLTRTTDTILSYSGFDLGYNELHEQAAWVAYVLTREEVESDVASRTDRFRPDTSVRSGSADLSDYRGSGYDRGHLAPAGDMRWSTAAMEHSFFLTNMSPQEPAFNRGIWRRLEEKVRQWAVEEDSLYVVTGPVLNVVRGHIGENRVGVPDAYFKVIVDLSPPRFGMAAFLIPHRGSDEEPTSFLLSVDSLEAVTGYDFFAFAPDQVMVEWLENHLQEGKWE